MAIKLHSLFGNLCLADPLPESDNPENDVAMALLQSTALREGLERMIVNTNDTISPEPSPSPDHTMDNTYKPSPRGM
jgi:hypothetical protein